MCHGIFHSNDTSVEDGFHDYSIVDTVVVPAGLPTGDYLISWRWDAEQTTQIWQNCADIHITAGAPPPARPLAPLRQW
jgi:predicted carbohydrate-binding protein with CBM5 and CBM33 domain